jgi:hypothetical protein
MCALRRDAYPFGRIVGKPEVDFFIPITQEERPQRKTPLKQNRLEWGTRFLNPTLSQEEGKGWGTQQSGAN